MYNASLGPCVFLLEVDSQLQKAAEGQSTLTQTHLKFNSSL